MRCGGSSDGPSVIGTVAAQETRWRQRDDGHGRTGDLALNLDGTSIAMHGGRGLVRARLAGLAQAASTLAALRLYPAAGMDATEPRARRRQAPHLDGHGAPRFCPARRACRCPNRAGRHRALHAIYVRADLNALVMRLPRSIRRSIEPAPPGHVGLVDQILSADDCALATARASTSPPAVTSNWSSRG
jgi:hypothetical protein